MSDMIERVAKAIYEKFEDRPTYAKRQMNGILAEELASAAIEAMREIPLGMVEAGNSALSSNGVDNVEDDDAAVCWQAMLDAALSQSPSSLPSEDR